MGWKVRHVLNPNLLTVALIGLVFPCIVISSSLGTSVAGSAEAAIVPAPVSMVGQSEMQLKERVLARWQALIKGDFSAAYQFESPAYRVIYNPNQFRYQFGSQVLWRMATIKHIHYDDGAVARVQVDLAFEYPELGKGHERLETNQEINELWFRKENQWWHQQ